MKFITTRCNVRLAKMKSANALSGLIPMKSLLFCGLHCNRKQTEKKTGNIVTAIFFKIINADYAMLILSRCLPQNAVTA